LLNSLVELVESSITVSFVKVWLVLNGLTWSSSSKPPLKRSSSDPTPKRNLVSFLEITILIFGAYSMVLFLEVYSLVYGSFYSSKVWFDEPNFSFLSSNWELKAFGVLLFRPLPVEVTSSSNKFPEKSSCWICFLISSFNSMFSFCC